MKPIPIPDETFSNGGRLNRRRFFGGLAGSLVLAGGSDLALGQRRFGPTDGRKAEQIALTELREIYRRDLFDDFLPFMDKYVIDHELGGFMCNADHTGARVNGNKLSWFEGRGSWVYAFLYNNLTREQKYLDVARTSLEFVLKSKPRN